MTHSNFFIFSLNKLGCVVRIVVDSILHHAESGLNDHRKDAPRFILYFISVSFNSLWIISLPGYYFLNE